MNNKKIVLNIVTALILIVSPGNAQVKSSVYSMFGVGALTDNNFGINRAFGGTGIAFQSGRSVNYLNPASYLGLFPDSYLMELGAYGIYNESRNDYQKQTDTDFNLGYFSANLYLYKWWASSAGIVPFSSVDYKISSTGNIEGELSTFKKTYEGSGGLNRIYIGNSVNVYKGFSLGVNLSYIFGPIKQTETAEGTGNFSGYEINNSRNVYGLYADYGMQYSFLDDDWQYTLGMIYGPGITLDSEDEKQFTYNGETTDLEQDETSDIKVPQKYGFGLAVKKADNFRAGFDFEYGNWGAIDFSNPNYSTKNSSRFSIGAEYHPGNNKSDNLFNSLYYRVGANYKNSYLEIDNTRISAMGISAGLGIPYDDHSIINISAEYGKEGTLNKGLIQNNYLVLYLNVSLYEFWAKKLRD